MRRGSNAGGKDGEKKKKKPVTNQEKAAFFVDKLQDSIAVQIEKGSLQINKSKRHIPALQTKVQLSLQNIEQNLSLIRASIVQQKKQQQQADKMKLAQAKEFITKMKKDKQQHRLKMRESEQRREMAYAKIFSDSAMELMRRKLDERVELKKREIEERIKEMAVKRQEREKTVAGQQNQYSEFVKGLKQKSRSSTKLPSITNPQKEQSNASVLTKSRKNSLTSIRKQLLPSRSSKNMEMFLQKQKVKDQSSRLKLLQLGTESLLQKMRSNNQISISKLEKNTHQKHENLSFLGNKSKVYGDQYFKQSLLKIKKPSKPETVNAAADIQSRQLQLQSHEAQINKNDRLQTLKENWLKVLSRIEHFEVSQQQGIDLLHSIQRKLDKIDSKGITQRLRNKLQIFAKLHPHSQQLQNKLELMV